MSSIFVHGIGAVSPAGWGMQNFREALQKNESLSAKEIIRPGWEKPLRVRQVPSPQPRPSFFSNARLRRTSPISQYATAAAMEALASDLPQISNGEIKLGVVLTVMSGCVNYSRRFYSETLRAPETASPLVFPETVFNAPASHIAALLGATAINYTLVGDPGTFLQGLALAAQWLTSNRVDGCVVIGAEEVDWLTSDAYRLFQKKIILSDGAGAVYLRREPKNESNVQLSAVTDSYLFLKSQVRHCAAQKMKAELHGANQQSKVLSPPLLCDGLQNLPRLDAAEAEAWKDWPGPRLSPKKVFGEGLMAAAAWQCIAAIDALQSGNVSSANVSVVGCNQQAIGALFSK